MCNDTSAYACTIINVCIWPRRRGSTYRIVLFVMAQDCIDQHLNEQDLEELGEYEQACCKYKQPTNCYLSMLYLPYTLMAVLKCYEVVIIISHAPGR